MSAIEIFDVTFNWRQTCYSEHWITANIEVWAKGS